MNPGNNHKPGRQLSVIDHHFIIPTLISNCLLSRQTESVRDHKFHSGMLIHRWFTDRGHFISHLHQTQE